MTQPHIHNNDFKQISKYASIRVLIIDDDVLYTKRIKKLLENDFEQVLTAKDWDEVENQLSPPPDVILLDIRFGDDPSKQRLGIEFLRRIRKILPHVPVIMVTVLSEIEIVKESLQLGAADYILKTAPIKELSVRIQNAIRKAWEDWGMRVALERLKRIDPGLLIGDSQAIQNIRKAIQAAADDGYITVLIYGETGTGKELVARSIHQQGWRCHGPFIPVMLNAIPTNLIESELFGHEKGAFTSADARRIGYLEIAHKGILFLDEISNVSLDVQVKLLRFLETGEEKTREFYRVGGRRPVRVDVQIIVATNVDLGQLVQEGKFRQDFYYRLKAFEIYIPPLRQRREDIPVLVEHFLNLFHKQGRSVIPVSREAMEFMLRYDWPGNVRELKTSLESALIRAHQHHHSKIEVVDLPYSIRVPESPNINGIADFTKNSQWPIDIHFELARLELQYAERALSQVLWRITKAWPLLSYNDRYAFSRRIRQIFTKYPQLKNEFPKLFAIFCQRRKHSKNS